MRSWEWPSWHSSSWPVSSWQVATFTCVVGLRWDMDKAEPDGDDGRHPQTYTSTHKTPQYERTSFIVRDAVSLDCSSEE